MRLGDEGERPGFGDARLGDKGARLGDKGGPWLGDNGAGLGDKGARLGLAPFFSGGFFWIGLSFGMGGF